jgi:hypothetical protein
VNAQPAGFLQVDVDGLWAVRACYGIDEEDTLADDPCWQEGVPRLARTFERAGVPGGFFIVGRDMEVAAKRRRVARLVAAGHEIGNHSYTHTIGLSARPGGVIASEIERTHEALVAVGARPAGFRAPGYDVDARVLRAVRRQGYLYDASLLPTWAVPLLRLADAVLARRSPFGRRQFGRLAYARAPRTPYFPRRHALRKRATGWAEAGLIEIPVGTTPTLQLPLTAASLFTMGAGRVRALMARLAARGEPVLLLLHAIDGTDCRRPIIFGNRRPAMGGFAMSGAEKGRRLRVIVEEFARHFAVERAEDFARRLRETHP